MSEKISLRVELEFFNIHLFNALKRSLTHAEPKRRLEIVYSYIGDPRVRFNVTVSGIQESRPSAKAWRSSFQTISTIRNSMR